MKNQCYAKMKKTIVLIDDIIKVIKRFPDFSQDRDYYEGYIAGLEFAKLLVESILTRGVTLEKEDGLIVPSRESGRDFYWRWAK